MVLLIAISAVAGYFVGYNFGYNAALIQAPVVTTAPTATTTPLKEAVKIGIMVPLSPPGDYKSGQIQLDAYRLGFKWVNDHGGVLGGRQIVMIGPYDDQGKPEIGVTMTRRLITDDGVAAIVAGWHSSVGLAQAKVANELKTPLINPASWTDEIPKLHSDYVFKIAVFNTEITLLMMPFLKQKAYKHIVFLGEDTDYGIDQGNSIETFLKNENIPYESFQKIIFPYDAVDFRSYLLQIKAMTPKPDVLIFAAVYQSMYLIPKQAKELGLYDMMDIIVGWDYPAWSPDWWEVAGEAGIGPIFPALFHPSLMTESGKEFQKAFKDAYGYDPSIYAFWAYDAIRVMADAIGRAGSTDREAITDALKESRYAGCLGEIFFETDPEKWPAIWNQWTGHILLMMQYTEVKQKFEDAKVVYTPL